MRNVETRVSQGVKFIFIYLKSHFIDNGFFDGLDQGNQHCLLSIDDEILFMEIIKKFSSMSNQISISNYMDWSAPINHLAPPLLSLWNTERQADAVCGPPSPPSPGCHVLQGSLYFSARKGVMLHSRK